MTYIWQRWIADELRAAGLTVIEVDGWENRGRPASTGSFNPTSGPTTHHTGATTWLERAIVTLRTLIIGRPDLPGPLCQVATAFNGVVYVIAAGRANHAGRVGKSGVKGMPLGADGNALALGNEVDTNGTQSLPPEQRHAIAVVNAVFLKHTGRPVDWAHRHADISGTGKWDIGSLTTNQIRVDAEQATTQEDDMPFTEKELRQIVREEVAAELDQAVDVEINGQKKRRSLRQMSREIFQSLKDGASQ